MSSELLYVPAEEGGRFGGVPFTVNERSSCSTLVELFHRCLLLGRPLTVEFISTLAALGDDSGVRLWLYLWLGRSGVTGVGGWLLRKEVNKEVRCRRIVWVVGTGSEDGVRLSLFTVRGVTGDGREVPVILRANLRNGEMDRESVLAELGVLDDLEPLGGVAR
jgi:hypothetical protein